jgi:uncharacterized protein (DUF1778 family)
MGMGRPKKDKRDRKDIDLRIPVTFDQKELIVGAARAAGEDMASWARPILIQAARDQLAKGGEAKRRQRQ